MQSAFCMHLQEKHHTNGQGNGYHLTPDKIMIKYMLQPNLSSSLSAMENCPNGMGNACLLPVYTLAGVKPTGIYISFQD